MASAGCSMPMNESHWIVPLDVVGHGGAVHARQREAA